MSWILGYGCTTAAGSRSQDFWSALKDGADCRTDVETKNWPGPPSPPLKAFQWSNSQPGTVRKKLGQQLLTAWRELLEKSTVTTQARLASGPRLGVILATTKSFVDDFIWDSGAALETDALGALLSDFLAAAKLVPARTAVVSNACASSLSALFLAEQWLKATDLSDVLVVAADAVGPFVIRGFESLKVLTSDAPRPFSHDRSGFQLGEGSAAILLSKIRPQNAGYFLRGVGVDAEGFAVTRPSQSGASLQRACRHIEDLLTDPPDLIVAHGTGTQVNDQLEDHVYETLFGQQAVRPLITAAKWCVGHTLGVSGALDLIAALKVLEHNQAFEIAKTVQIDQKFKGDYLTSGAAHAKGRDFQRVLVCSLGFGGIHAAALVAKVASDTALGRVGP